MHAIRRGWLSKALLDVLTDSSPRESGPAQQKFAIAQQIAKKLGRKVRESQDDSQPEDDDAHVAPTAPRVQVLAINSVGAPGTKSSPMVFELSDIEHLVKAYVTTTAMEQYVLLTN